MKTYAEYKIRGAILDSLRDLDWAPRQQRKRAKLIESAIAVLEQRLQRSPAEDEIANHLNLSMAEYQDWLSDARGLTLGAWKIRVPKKRGATCSSMSRITRSRGLRISLNARSWNGSWRRSIDRMPRIEKTVLSLYYYEELTLREIAQIVDLHESRISQLKSQAILRLRSYMQKQWPRERGAA